MVLPEADEIAPMNSGGRVKGIERNVSEAAGSDVVVKPTGSVVTVVTAEAALEKTMAAASAARREK